jgi:hypothetical protein
VLIYDGTPRLVKVSGGSKSPLRVTPVRATGPFDLAFVNIHASNMNRDFSGAEILLTGSLLGDMVLPLYALIDETKGQEPTSQHFITHCTEPFRDIKPVCTD